MRVVVVPSSMGLIFRSSNVMAFWRGDGVR